MRPTCRTRSASCWTTSSSSPTGWRGRSCSHARTGSTSPPPGRWAKTCASRGAAATPASRSARATWTTSSASFTSRTSSAASAPSPRPGRRRGGPLTTFQEVARETAFVPETLELARLLKRMRTERFHLAAVIDEYGGVSGVVTLEDVIEEIVGQISDEFDVDKPEILKVDEGI